MDPINYHLSYFHQYLLINASPELARRYYELHERRDALKRDMELVENEIAALIRANGLKKARKPDGYNHESVGYRNAVAAHRDEVLAGKPVHITEEEVREEERAAVAKRMRIKPPEITPTTSQDMRSRMLDMINRNRPKGQDDAA